MLEGEPASAILQCFGDSHAMATSLGVCGLHQRNSERKPLRCECGGRITAPRAYGNVGLRRADDAPILFARRQLLAELDGKGCDRRHSVATEVEDVA
jgi:hypothetical protein